MRLYQCDVCGVQGTEPLPHLFLGKDMPQFQAPLCLKEHICAECSTKLDAWLNHPDRHCLTELDKKQEVKTVCPKCSSSDWDTCHHQATLALPECNYKKCIDCGHVWDQT